MRDRRFVVAALALLAALAPACSGGDGDGDSFRLDLDGSASIASQDETRTLDAGEHDVAVGDTVRMLEGSAVLELPGEREVWLRTDTTVTVDAKPEVLDGDAVVLVEDGTVSFTAGGVDVQVEEGAARVSRGLGVTVAMYRGRGEVRSAGRSFDGGLAALRQVTIAASGLLPREPVPIVYDESAPDPWDRRFLGDAIDLSRDLDGMSRGFTAQLGPRARASAGLLRDVLPPLASEPAFIDTLVDGERSPGESLIGAAIVVEASGSFAERWNQVFSFRAAGARWGLVALDQEVRRDALRGRIDEAIGRSPLLFAVGSSPPPTRSPSTTAAPPPPPGDGGPSDDPDEPDEPDPSPPTTIPPPPVPPPEDDIFDVLDSLVGGDDPAVELVTGDSASESLLEALLP